MSSSTLTNTYSFFTNTITVCLLPFRSFTIWWLQWSYC